MHNCIEIIVYHDNLYTLDCKGYRTYTYLDRLNRYAPVAIYKRGRQWYLRYPNNPLGKEVAYFDGIQITMSGCPLVREFGPIGKDCI